MNFQIIDLKFSFHDSFEKSNSAIVKNLKIIFFNTKRKHNHTQSCIEDETIKTSLIKNLDDVFTHIDVKNNTTKNSLNFICFTKDVKTIDHDVNLISILNYCASVKNFYIKNMSNVTSKSIKNTVNNLNHMQSDNRNTNCTTTLRQKFSFIDIDSEKKLMKKINHIEKRSFQLNKTLNVNLNMNFVFNNYNFKINVVNLTQAIQIVVINLHENSATIVNFQFSSMTSNLKNNVENVIKLEQNHSKSFLKKIPTKFNI